MRVREPASFWQENQSRPQSLRYFCPADGATGSPSLYKRIAASGNEIAGKRDSSTQSLYYEFSKNFGVGETSY